MCAKTTAKDRENPEVGKRLKEKREAMKVTQKDMAHYLGITIQAYQNYEYGKEISSGRIIQICNKLKCSPNWLLGISEEGAHLAPDSLLLHQLREAFERLNTNGQQEAVKRVQELSKLPEYTEQAKKGDSSAV